MSTTINTSHLLELTTEEQQLISGGYGHCSPCPKPMKGCGHRPYMQTCGDKPYYKNQPYKDYGYSPDYC